jgi:hypothetical protein
MAVSIKKLGLLNIFLMSWIFLLSSCSEESNFTSRSSINTIDKKPDPENISDLGNVGGEDDYDSADVIGSENIEDILGDIIGGEGGFHKCEARSKVTDQPIEADVYRLENGTGSLPNLAAMSPVDKICMDNFDVPTRSFTEGFPGVPDLYEWFALRARAKLVIPQGGSYTFYLNSDDGSILYIDGKMVIDNDGLHSTSEKSATVSLTKGIHDFELRYYQGPATEIALQLFWSTPFDSDKKITAKSFFRYYPK